MVAMAKTRSRWLTHGRLVTLEALLLVGAGQTWLEDQVLAREDLHRAVRVGFVMALMIGVFSAVLLWVERFTRSSVTKTHDVVQALPIPTPLYAIHGLTLAGIFCLYAVVYELWPLF